jgi:branched-chain amino acid transport system substrate-binding protein
MELCRSRARCASLFTLLIAAMIAVSAFAVPAQAASADSGLGTKTPAKGTPVKIGLITDGKTSGTDNTIETPVSEAAVKWINQYRNGVGGHPIDLDICTNNGDPSKSADCANQMIQDDVAAVVFGSNQFALNAWTPLHDAGIPVFIFGSGTPDLLKDTASTFILGSGSTFENLIISAAKAQKTKKATAVVIDVPAATQIFADTSPYKKAGLDFSMVPVALGTADMTPQMQKVVTDNPKGVVHVVGNDGFCIAAFNGLRTAGFQGQVTAIPQCFSDATRTSVPKDFLEGIKITSSSPVDNPKDPSIKQYYAVLDKFGASDVDKSRQTGLSMFQGITGLNVATQNLKGDATPASIIAAAKAMPWSVLPGTGGYHIRCNGKASANPKYAATCTNATLLATLGADGKATKYVVAGDTQIPA